MRPRTNEEKKAAMAKLPKPIFDFMGTQALINIYAGIRQKFGLNIRQGWIADEITNVTLMGLESESALETNLHQWLPELSNASTRELVADINDRVFKEAKRRLQENIIEPEPAWNEEDLGPKDAFKLPLSDAEIERIAEEETKTGKPILIPEVEEGADEPDEPDTEEEEEDGSIEIVPTTIKPIGTIVEEKMGAAVQTKPEQVPAENLTSEKQGVVTPIAVETPKPVYKGGVDPYREPVE